MKSFTGVNVTWLHYFKCVIRWRFMPELRKFIVYIKKIKRFFPQYCDNRKHNMIRKTKWQIMNYWHEVRPIPNKEVYSRVKNIFMGCFRIILYYVCYFLNSYLKTIHFIILNDKLTVKKLWNGKERCVTISAFLFPEPSTKIKCRCVVVHSKQSK